METGDVPEIPTDKGKNEFNDDENGSTMHYKNCFVVLT